jgi:hypothetical protein
LEDEVLELDLLERLDSADLCELRECFFSNHIYTGKEQTHSKKAQRKKYGMAKAVQENKYGGQPLTKRQFVKAIEKIIGK